MKFPAARDVHFDIDHYLNRMIPRSRLSCLPKSVSRFLGYRETARQEVGNILIATWALIGAFCGLAVVTAVYKYIPAIQQWHPPVIIASLGAAAILDYNVIESPLAQPRSSIVGNTLAATVGVSVAKMFMLSPDFENIRWLAGPLCCGLASWVMTMTNTIYPPGGATAILAGTDPTVGELGWIFVPVVLLGSVLMLGVALITNNIQRQYPIFWWTPRDISRQRKADITGASEDGEEKIKKELGVKEEVEIQHRIVITENHILLPEQFSLGSEEMEILEVLRDRLSTADRQFRFRSRSNSDLTAHSSRDVLPLYQVSKVS